MGFRPLIIPNLIFFSVLARTAQSRCTGYSSPMSATSGSGTIKSPRYPATYNINEDCLWNLNFKFKHVHYLVVFDVEEMQTSYRKLDTTEDTCTAEFSIYGGKVDCRNKKPFCNAYYFSRSKICDKFANERYSDCNIFKRRTLMGAKVKFNSGVFFHRHTAQKGFKLKYRFIDCREATTTSAATTTTTTTVTPPRTETTTTPPQPTTTKPPTSTPPSTTTTHTTSIPPTTPSTTIASPIISTDPTSPIPSTTDSTNAAQTSTVYRLATNDRNTTIYEETRRTEDFTSEPNVDIVDTTSPSLSPDNATATYDNEVATSHMFSSSNGLHSDGNDKTTSSLVTPKIPPLTTQQQHPATRSESVTEYRSPSPNKPVGSGTESTRFDSDLAAAEKRLGQPVATTIGCINSDCSTAIPKTSVNIVWIIVPVAIAILIIATILLIVCIRGRRKKEMQEVAYLVGFENRTYQSQKLGNLKDREERSAL